MSYLGEFVDGGALKTDGRGEGEDINIARHCGMRDRSASPRTCVHVCAVCVYVVSCAAFVSKRLHQRVCVCARVCVYAVCMCMRACMFAFVCCVGELQAAWHIHTDQLVRVTCPTSLLLYINKIMDKGQHPLIFDLAGHYSFFSI